MTKSDVDKFAIINDDNAKPPPPSRVADSRATNTLFAKINTPALRNSESSNTHRRDAHSR